MITLAHILRYSQATVGFGRVNYSNLIFKTQNNEKPSSKIDIYVGPLLFGMGQFGDIL